MTTVPFTHVVVTAPNRFVEEVYLDQLEDILRPYGLINITVVSDPAGLRIGSGGGTLNALEKLRTALGRATIQAAKVLIIHSGGDSRRAPLHSVSGKAFASINASPSFSSSSQSSSADYTTPIAILIQELFSYFSKALPSPCISTGYVCIASSDVMLDLCSDDPHCCNTIPTDGVTVITVPEVVDIAMNHGVLVQQPPLSSHNTSDDDEDTTREGHSTRSSIAMEYLQKPSLALMQQKNAICLDTNKALIDTGLVIFTGPGYIRLLHLLEDPYVCLCTERGIQALASTTHSFSYSSSDSHTSLKVLRLELYSDILMSLCLTRGMCTLEEYSKKLGIQPSLHEQDLDAYNGHIQINSNEELYRLSLIKIWSYLKEIPLHVVNIAQGSFCHLGTSEELLDLLSYDDNTTGNASHGTAGGLDEHMRAKLLQFHSKYHLHRNCVHGQSILINSRVHDDDNSINNNNNGAPGDDNENLYPSSLVEHCVLPASLSIGRRCILSHIHSGILSAIPHIMDHMMMQQIYLQPSRHMTTSRINSKDGGKEGRREMVLSILGLKDSIKTSFEHPSSTVCEASWPVMMNIAQCHKDDIWPVECKDKSLWNAKLFVVMQERMCPCAKDAKEDAKDAKDSHKSAKEEKDGVGYGIALLGPSDSLQVNTLMMTWLQYIKPFLDTQTETSTTAFCEYVAICTGVSIAEAMEALQRWKDSERLALSDLINAGCSENMVLWRDMLQVYASQASVESSSKDEKQMENENLQYLVVLSQSFSQTKTIILHTLIDCVHSNSPVILTSSTRLSLLTVRLMLLLNLVSLCVQSNSSSALVRTIIAFIQYNFHDDKNVNSTPSMHPKYIKIILSTYFSLMRNMTGRESHYNSLLLSLLIRQSHLYCKGSGNGVIVPLLQTMSNINEKSVPRCLFLAAWVIRHIYCHNHNDKSINDEEELPVPMLQDLEKAENVTGMSQMLIAHINGDADGDEGSQLLALSVMMERGAQQMIRRHVSLSLQNKLTSAFTTQVTTPSGEGQSGDEIDGTKVHPIITVTAPARIDLAGGWSDTPPICYERPAAVMNMACQVDGKKPLLCSARLIDIPIIKLYSMKRRDEDKEVTVSGHVLAHYSDFEDMQTPNQNMCSLLMACVCVAFGLHPSDSHETDTLAQKLTATLGGGLEIACMSTLPAGSGMGGSSILAAAILRCIYEVVNARPSNISYPSSLAATHSSPLSIKDDSLTDIKLVNMVSLVEQLLTTGGGWQDQCGCLGGIRYSTSNGELPLLVETERIESILTNGGQNHYDSTASINTNSRKDAKDAKGAKGAKGGSSYEAVIGHINQRLCLVYTGVSRLAKNTLINALRAFSLTPLYAQDSTVASLVEETKQAVIDIRTYLTTLVKDNDEALDDQTIALVGNKIIATLATTLNRYWSLKKSMAKGSEPPYITTILERLKPVSLGCSLAGAGAGGFIVVIMKEGVQRKDVQQLVRKLNESDTDDSSRGSMEGGLSVHECSIDLNGMAVHCDMHEDLLSALLSHV